MKQLFRIHDALTKATFWAAAVGVAYLTLVTAGEVFSRYVLATPTDWAPDTAAVAFALVTFFAVPWLTWQAGHASMDFLVNAAPARVSVWMQRLSYAIGLIVCGACAWIGALETARQITSGVMILSVTPIPKWVVFIPLVYALSSSALYFARHLLASFDWRDGAGSKEDDAWSGM